MPECLARTAPKPGLPSFEGLRDRLSIHPRQHQHCPVEVVLHDHRNQALIVKPKRIKPNITHTTPLLEAILARLVATLRNAGYRSATQVDCIQLRSGPHPKSRVIRRAPYAQPERSRAPLQPPQSLCPLHYYGQRPPVAAQLPHRYRLQRRG